MPRFVIPPRRLLIVLWCLFFAAAAEPGAQRLYDPTPSPGRVGLKIGAIWQASLWTDNDRQLTAISTSGGFFFDFPVGRRAFASVEIDLHDLQAFGQGNKWFHLLLTAKRVFATSDKAVTLRPFAGAGIGYFSAFEDYRVLNDSAPDSLSSILLRLNSTTSFVYKAGLEVVTIPNRKGGWLAEVAVMGAPFDIDNPDRRIRYGPTLLLRLGLIL